MARSSYLALGFPSYHMLFSGFSKCISDTSLFLYHHADITCYILVCVDDIIKTGSSSEYVTELNRRLYSYFTLKELGIIYYFLGVHATLKDDTLNLHQQCYILDLL